MGSTTDLFDGASDDLVTGPNRPPLSEQAARTRDGTVTLGAGCRRGLVTLTAVHEFGHVLGLDHESRRRSLTYWLKHPLTRDDIRGLRALYG